MSCNVIFEERGTFDQTEVYLNWKVKVALSSEVSSFKLKVVLSLSVKTTYNTSCAKKNIQPLSVVA